MSHKSHEHGKAAPSLSHDSRLHSLGLKSGKIKHIVYIVKENRTDDHVLCDLPQGNGDSSLVLFGKDVTPNLHALAERFALLDNFYDCGEVNGDGWPWSTGHGQRIRHQKRGGSPVAGCHLMIGSASTPAPSMWYFSWP